MNQIKAISQAFSLFVGMLALILFMQSCGSKNLLRKHKLPLLETYKVEKKTEDLPTQQIITPTNISINGAHINFRNLAGSSYLIYLNSVTDSVIVTNRGEVVAQLAVPLSKSIPINQLYYHNHDSVFLFIARYHVLDNRSKGVDVSDIYLLNREGTIINQYCLDRVPHIASGLEAPTISLRPSLIEHKRIIRTQLLLPFSIEHPPFKDTVHKELKVQLICNLDLATGDIEMLNVYLSDKLLGTNLTERANASGPEYVLHDDSLLIYYFWSSPSIYVYNLNRHSVHQAYTSNNRLFTNVRGINPGDYLVRFGEIRYSERERLFLRQISVTEYKSFDPFEVIQVFDHTLKEKGYFFVNHQGLGPLYFDNEEQLSLLQLEPRVQFRIQLRRPRWRTIGYFEETYLAKTVAHAFDENLINTNYQDRMQLYLNRFKFPDSSKILIYSMQGACSNMLDFFMQTYRENLDSYKEKNVYYLFFDTDADALQRTIKAYQVDDSMIITDTERLFMKYLMPKEYSLQPLVKYQNDRNITLVFFERDVLPLIFKGFMEVR